MERALFRARVPDARATSEFLRALSHRQMAFAASLKFLSLRGIPRYQRISALKCTRYFHVVRIGIVAFVQITMRKKIKIDQRIKIQYAPDYATVSFGHVSSHHENNLPFNLCNLCKFAQSQAFYTSLRKCQAISDRAKPSLSLNQGYPRLLSTRDMRARVSSAT